ncbi:MAG: hypothetical protein JSS81_21175 [Acidobacteria bacterium]|nr:hypothetical protein [Acidobacteriota bacterium]
MKYSISIFLAILFLSLHCAAQTSSLTSGIITATMPQNPPCSSNAVNRNIQLFGEQTEIDGYFDATRPGGSVSECSPFSCCNYGRGYIINDSFVGLNNLQYAAGPVIINGTTYSFVYFRGGLNVTGTIRIPFHLRKKPSATLVGKVAVSGGVSVFLTPQDVTTNNYIYSKNFSDPNAVATITIEPNQVFPGRFSVRTIKYEFVNGN